MAAGRVIAAARLLLGLLTVGLSCAAGVNALANYWRIKRPDIALQWRPDDSVALSFLEDQRLEREANAGALAAPNVMIARKALRTGPLTAPALRQLGTERALANKLDEARGLMQLANVVSRRELGANIWLIDDSLNRDDLAAALRYFDAALTTEKMAADLLYPALAAGLFGAELRAGLVPYLREGRAWMVGFLNYAAAPSGSAEFAADLVMAAGGLSPSPGSSALNGRILGALAAKTDFKPARAYLRQLTGKNEAILSDLRFTTPTTDPNLGPFAWHITSEVDAGGQIDGSGTLDIYIGPALRATVARRTLTLLPGSYRIKAPTLVSSGHVAITNRWEIRCNASDSGSAIWVYDVPHSSKESAMTQQFTIPAECSGQYLSLTIANEDDQEEAVAKIISPIFL